jgi:hypothetical protein
MAAGAGLVLAASWLLAPAPNPSPFATALVFWSRDPAWRVEVRYQDGSPDFTVTLHLDDQWHWRLPTDPPDPDARDDQYAVTSTLPWAPGWYARVRGRISDVLVVGGGGRAPEPLHPMLALALARSYRAILVARLTSGEYRQQADFERQGSLPQYGVPVPRWRALLGFAPDDHPRPLPPITRPSTPAPGPSP